MVTVRRRSATTVITITRHTRALLMDSGGQIISPTGSLSEPVRGSTDLGAGFMDADITIVDFMVAGTPTAD